MKMTNARFPRFQVEAFGPLTIEVAAFYGRIRKSFTLGAYAVVPVQYEGHEDFQVQCWRDYSSLTHN